MAFTKSDLKLSYFWTTTPGDSKLTGEPDSSLFNKHEGYEVLYLANHLSFVSTVEELHKFEDLIRNYLPSDIRSQINVKNWIIINWN